MVNKEYILNLKTRRQIYSYILKYPGLHLRELCRKLNMPKTTLDYHLNYLEKNGLILSKPEKHYTRYYVKEQVGNGDKELIKLFRQEVPRKIILLLLSGVAGDSFKSSKIYWQTKANPDTRFIHVSIKELIGLTKYWKWDEENLFHLRKKRSTIAYHLNKLLDAGIIEKVQIGKEMKYKLNDIDTIHNFVIEHKEALSNELIDTWLSWDNDMVGRYLTDRAINTFYEIFPHPYHV